MAKLALIVDDNRALAEGLAEILEARGYEIRVFDDPERALREAQGLPFDVALLDVRMPGMDGVTLQRHLRAERPGARFVLMTAYADDQRIAEGVAAGVCAVLSKPVPLEQLFDALGEGARKLLIVDDDVAFAGAITEALMQDGYDCTVARNAAEARALSEAQRARGAPFALALVDVRLPDSSGVELAEELGARSRLPCLLMTGWDPETLAEGGKVPAEVLVKPFSVDRLLRALSAARSAQP